jgi:hypothetical protein
MLTKQGEPVITARKGAEARIRTAMKQATGGYARVEVNELDALLAEVVELRARNAALFREMSQPLPGMEG